MTLNIIFDLVEICGHWLMANERLEVLCELTNAIALEGSGATLKKIDTTIFALQVSITNALG
jgi:hypothetical protein